MPENMTKELTKTLNYMSQKPKKNDLSYEYFLVKMSFSDHLFRM